MKICGHFQLPCLHMDLPFYQPLPNFLQGIIYGHNDIAEALSVNQDDTAFPIRRICPNKAYGMVVRGHAMVCP